MDERAALIFFPVVSPVPLSGAHQISRRRASYGLIFGISALAIFIFLCSPLSHGASLEKVVSESAPSIVVVKSDVGEGSGVIIGGDGVIVTNLHVLENAGDLYVITSAGERFDDIGVIDFDERKDIAVLKIKGFDLPTARLGNSNSIRSGQQVFAVGAPLGYEQTISSGVVSAVRMMDAGFKAIQTDAAISPGSSGGGLFNSNGDLMGILTAFSAGGQNLNFAVPINYVRGMLGQAVAYSEPDFLALDVMSNRFGEEVSRLSGKEKVEHWISKLSSELTELEWGESDEFFFLTIGNEATVGLRPFDDLLWIVMPIGDEQQFNEDQYSKILSLTRDIDYAYLSVIEDQLYSNFELSISGSDYMAFKVYFASVLKGYDSVIESGLLEVTGSYDQEGAFAKGSATSRKQLDHISKGNNLRGLQQVEPAGLGVLFGYDGLSWDAVDQADGSVQFNSKDNDRWAKVYVESAELDTTNIRKALGMAMELYVGTLYDNEEVSQIEFLEEGYRKIQGRPSIWRQMSMYAAGFKVYWLTTMVHLDNKVITFHAWRLSPGLQPLNATTRLFFENARF